MAQIYHPKKTSTKLAEGVVAGLVGGVVWMALMLMVDLLTENRSWWSTPSVFGSIFTGVQDFNTAAPDVASLLLGIILQLLVFVLIGIGLQFYRPIFFRLKLNLILGGIIFAAILTFGFLMTFNMLGTNFLGRQNLIALLLASAIGGAAAGWWLARPQPQAASQNP